MFFWVEVGLIQYHLRVVTNNFFKYIPLSFSQLLSTISTSELSQFLSQPSVIDNNSDICVIFNNYNNTPAFLETVSPLSECCNIPQSIIDKTYNFCMSILQKK